MKKSPHLLIRILLLIIVGYLFFSKNVNPKEDRLGQKNILLPFLDQKFCNAISEKAIAENDISDDYKEITSTGACQISIGKGVNYIFLFENTSTSTDKKFVLNIYNSEDKLTQTIPLDYNWSFNLSTINLNDDINFDGYKDLLVRVFGPRAPKFTYYIYDPIKKLFVPDDTLSNIFTPTFNKKNETISSTPEIPNYYYDKDGQQQYYTPEEQTSVFEFINGKYVAKHIGVMK